MDAGGFFVSTRTDLRVAFFVHRNHALGTTDRNHNASEFLRPPGTHEIGAYDDRAANLASRYLSRISPVYRISTVTELADD